MAELIVFGEYKGFLGKGDAVRYLKGNRLTSPNAVPAEVQAYITSQLKGRQPTVLAPAAAPAQVVPDNSTRIPVQKFPPPSEEEKARLRAESLQVKPELQLTPAEEAQRAPDATFEPTPEPNQNFITQEDFDGSYNPEDVEAAHEAREAVTPNTAPNPEYFESGLPAPEMPTPVVDENFLESVSVYTAPLETLVQALYDRFGVYTAYLLKRPDPDEINPLTGEMFTKYHLGIAYQAAIRVENNPAIIQMADTNMAAIKEGRYASAHVRESFVPQATTMDEHRDINSFDYRTSVEGQRDRMRNAGQRPDPDGSGEQIVEPMFGKQVIRPNW
jgi:hypothetical protein